MDIVNFGILSALVITILRKRKSWRSNVIVDDPETFDEKHKTMIKGGPSKLQVVIDFDRTISMYHGTDGKRGKSCHGIVESRRSEEIKAKAESLNAVYFPIETDPNLSVEEKIPYMLKWYDGVHALLVECGVTRRMIAEDVKNSNVQLRPGIVELFDWCASKNIPVTIFSAGIGDVLTEVIGQMWRPLTPNMRVVSNKMEFAGDDLDAPIIGFSDPCIHMFSKDSRHMSHEPWFDSLKEHPNVLLIGDGLGDAIMANGLPVVDTVLRFGFLNHDFETLKPHYTKTFDSVTVGDSPAWEILKLIRQMDD